MSATADHFAAVNPHALAAIVEAGASGVVVVSEPIVDERGVELWPRGQPVSGELAERLRQRRLRQPLETSLVAHGGVSPALLRRAATDFLATDHAIVRASRRWAQPLLGQIAELELQPVAQLLLSTLRATRAPAFDHAVRAMLLAGAMLARQGADADELRLGLLGGLLHDLGELYLDPVHLDRSTPLTAQGHKHLAAHPRIGEMLLSGLTAYPKPLAAAVGQHHERLDGSGYPGRSAGSAVSRLGRVLAVAEAAVGVLSAPDVPCARASFALRAVPGEFDPAWIGLITAAVEPAAAACDEGDQGDAGLDDGGDMQSRLDALDARIGMAQVLAQGMLDDAALSTAVHLAAARAVHLLERLRAGWNSIGLWSAAEAGADAGGEVAREVRMARQELRFRLRSIERECLWSEPALSGADQSVLAPLWAFLDSPLDD